MRKVLKKSISLDENVKDEVYQKITKELNIILQTVLPAMTERFNKSTKSKYLISVWNVRIKLPPFLYYIYGGHFTWSFRDCELICVINELLSRDTCLKVTRKNKQLLNKEDIALLKEELQDFIPKEFGISKKNLVHVYIFEDAKVKTLAFLFLIEQYYWRTRITESSLLCIFQLFHFLWFLQIEPILL